MEERKCVNCMYRRNGECFSREVCADFKYVPSMTAEQERNWPREMGYHYGSMYSSDYAAVSYRS